MIGSASASSRTRAARVPARRLGSAPPARASDRFRPRIASARSGPRIAAATPAPRATITPPAVPRLKAHSALTSATGLPRYLKEIHDFPILDLATEQSLAQRWRRHGDLAAAHQLITSHLRLVAKMAAGYRAYGLPLAELISEGNIGLIQAVERFEPERGFRLATYAMWWIRASIQEYVLHSWSMVKIGTTAAQKKLFFGLRKIKARLKVLDDGTLAPETRRRIAREFAVSEVDVANMNSRLAARDASLNGTAGGETGTSEWQDYLPDERPEPETMVAEAEELSVRHDLVRDAFAALDERDCRILTERRLNDPPKTLEEIGQRLGISRERVRQIENRAYEKVSRCVKTAILERGLVLT